jgi:hypothetical protein
MDYFAKREWGIAPNGWTEFHGRWVVRDATFAYVDHDRFRYDLTDRYKDLIIIGD